MLRAGHVLLIIGVIFLFIAVVLSIRHVSEFGNFLLLKNTLINEVEVPPDRSVNATTQVTDPTRPVTIAIYIQGSEGSSAQRSLNDMRLLETVIDPAGTMVSQNEFSANFFTTFTPRQVGNHVLIIANSGTKPVTIDATIGYIPFIISNGKGQQQVVDSDQLLTPGILALIGTILTIVGIIMIKYRKGTINAQKVTHKPPSWIDKLGEYGLTLITGSLTVGLIVSVIDFVINPQFPPARYPNWLITILIAVAGAILIGISKLTYSIWLGTKGTKPQGEVS